MLKLLLLPSSRGYRVRERQAIVQTGVPGGPGKYRLDMLDGDITVDCEFQLTAEQYQYFRSFYNVNGRGAFAFEIDLILETFALRTYVAKFQPGGFRLRSVEGHTFKVQTLLDVTTNLSGLDLTATLNAFEAAATEVPPAPVGSPIRKLMVLPDKDQYGIRWTRDTGKTGIRNVPSERTRSSELHTEIEVECQFSLERDEYDYFRAFYNTMAKGANPFLVDLQIDEAGLGTYLAHFSSGEFKLERAEGDLIQVRTELDVVPRRIDLDYAQLVAAWEEEPYVAPVYPTDFGHTEE